MKRREFLAASLGALLFPSAALSKRPPHASRVLGSGLPLLLGRS